MMSYTIVSEPSTDDVNVNPEPGDCLPALAPEHMIAERDLVDGWFGWRQNYTIGKVTAVDETRERGRMWFLVKFWTFDFAEKPAQLKLWLSEDDVWLYRKAKDGSR
jgi:hypothetical protein